MTTITYKNKQYTLVQDAYLSDSTDDQAFAGEVWCAPAVDSKRNGYLVKWHFSEPAEEADNNNWDNEDNISIDVLTR